MLIIKIPYGSHVYETNTVISDNDFLYIVNSNSNPDQHIYTKNEYQSALDEHRVIPLECYFYCNNNLFTFKLDKWKLRQEFSRVSSNSWVKCKKKLQDGETYIGLKSLFHSLRILNFGIQIAEHGSIQCYTVYKDLFKEIMSNKDKDWEFFDNKYRLYRNELNSKFRKLCPKNEQIT